MSTLSNEVTQLQHHAGVGPFSTERIRTSLTDALAHADIDMDQCSNDYHPLAKALWCLFSSPTQEALRQLVEQGPVWDGDVISKTQRDTLLILGLASRACVKGEQGYTVANYRGADVLRAGNTA
mgnify:CR=1 FL=1